MTKSTGWRMTRSTRACVRCRTAGCNAPRPTGSKATTTSAAASSLPHNAGRAITTMVIAARYKVMSDNNTLP